MNLSQVLLFWGGIILYRLLLNQKGKIWVILTASIFGVFWLQPALLVRNMDYWFPFISISLILITWLVITPKDEVVSKQNVISLLVILIISLFIPFSRYLPFEFNIISTFPPQPFFVIMAVFLLLIWLIFFYFFNYRNNKIFSYFVLLFILFIFIILKTPSLNSKIGMLLRTISGQSTNIIQELGADLRWLGFSYIAFRLIHTIRDFQNKRYQITNLNTYFAYVLFFPALVAGPIDRIEHFENEINKKTEKLTDFLTGGKRLAIGLLKKFVIADSLVMIALNANNALLTKSTFWLWIMLFAYAWMIYFDFSGYTDIALGLSACIGITLPENFDRPYSAQNLTLFWNKWHISLTQWFRSYFFNPLTRFLRSREKPISQTSTILIAQLSTMTLIGLWHGISWNFLFWGLWHGAGLFLHNQWSSLMQRIQGRSGPRKSNQKIVFIFSKIFTFIFVALGWIWFVIPDPKISIIIFEKLFGLH